MPLFKEWALKIKIHS